MIIRDKKELKKIIEDAIEANKGVLIKKGVFDIIHPGHIFALQNFKKKADIVIILTQSDAFTKKKKGNERPINPQLQRAEVIDGIKGVDYVYLDNSQSREEYIDFLNYLRPSILAVTSVDSKKTQQYSSPYWKLIEFPDKNKVGYSTTAIIERIISKYKK